MDPELINNLNLTFRPRTIVKATVIVYTTYVCLKVVHAAVDSVVDSMMKTKKPETVD